MQLSELDGFFNEHPLKEQYFSFSESERRGTLAVASRDIQAQLDGYTVTEEENGFFEAAVAEQCIFLLLNPEYLTGAYTRVTSLASSGNNRKFSTQDSVLGQRAAAMLAPLLARKAMAESADGDPGEDSPDDDGDTEEKFCSTLRLSRG